MPKQFKIESQNSNKSWSFKRFKEFSTDLDQSATEKATAYANRLSKRTGFTHRAVFNATVGEPEPTEEELRSQDEERMLDDLKKVLEEDEETPNVDEPEANIVSDMGVEQESLEDVPENQVFYDWEDQSEESDFPHAWWLKKEFVAKDGSVYQKGDLVPELYRTKEPTDY